MRWCIYFQLTLAAFGAGLSQASCRMWRWDLSESWKAFAWNVYELVMFLSFIAILVGPVVLIEITRRRFANQQHIGGVWVAELSLIYTHFLTALPGAQ